MNRVIRIVMPLVILVVAVGLTVALVKSKPTAAKKAPEARLPQVQTVTVDGQSALARIPATGVVKPAREVVISPQVSGKVVWQSPALVPGGRVRKGATLFKVDARDYEINLAQEQGRVAQARFQLELEQAQHELKKREWKLVDKELPKDAALALRIPHLKNAEEQVAAAQAGLARAELNLERTAVRAPFNAMVLQERVEVGQLVQPGAQVATLVGTDSFWITASVPVEKLASINVPGSGGDANGSRVEVVQRLDSGEVYTREGRVLRLFGGLDPQTRTARVVVGLDNPLDTSSGPPLLPDAFVDLYIEGKELDEVFVLPREAVFNGDRVWTVDAESQLHQKKVRVAFGTDREVFIDQGLAERDRVVVTRMSMPLEGAKVKATDATLRQDTTAAAETAPSGIDVAAKTSGGVQP